MAFFAAYIPYEQGERYALGEKVEVSIWAAFGAVVWLGLMAWYIWKVRREKAGFRKGKK